MHMPRALSEAEGQESAEYLCLEFLRGTVHVGTFKLAIDKITHAKSSKVDSPFTKLFMHGIIVC